MLIYLNDFFSPVNVARLVLELSSLNSALSTEEARDQLQECALQVKLNVYLVDHCLNSRLCLNYCIDKPPLFKTI